MVTSLHRTGVPDQLSLDEVRRVHVLAVLAACDGNRTHAAAVLKVDRKTLYRMLRKWGPIDEYAEPPQVAYSR